MTSIFPAVPGLFELHVFICPFSFPPNLYDMYTWWHGRLRTLSSRVCKEHQEGCCTWVYCIFGFQRPLLNRRCSLDYVASCEAVSQAAFSRNTTRPVESRAAPGKTCSNPGISSFLLTSASPLSPHLSRTSVNVLFFLLALVSSFLLLIVACLSPRLWKTLGLVWGINLV